MTLRFYIDEDCMRQSLITGLRARNVDVVTVYVDMNKRLSKVFMLEDLII